MQEFLKRMADALDRIAPKHDVCDMNSADFFYFDSDNLSFVPVKNIKYVPLNFLVGIEHQKQTMVKNTMRFLEGKPANNALLWGARGCGKSSLIKAVVMEINQKEKDKLCLIEVKKHDLKHLNKILKILGETNRRFIIYCDDLCFDSNDKEIFRYLKTLLDGSLASVPDNIIFYATSNRRHLVKADKQSTEMSALEMKENADEGVALSDRFGLWLGFHEIGQDEYIKIVQNYVKLMKIDIDNNSDELIDKALEWSRIRGSRSGRVAYQFVKSL